MAKLLRFWQRGRRLVVALLFVVVATGLWQYQARQQAGQSTWMGVPTWDSLTPTRVHRVLPSDGYLVGWSDVRVGALWVSYQVHAVDDSHIGSRPDFSRDWRTLWPIATDSYFGSGFDRGHLAPNYAIAAVHGREAQIDTFRMSNMLPQKPALNRQLWQRLEEAIMDHFAPRFARLQVVTGPIYPPSFMNNVFNRVGLVEVPTAFYKIIVAPDAAKPKALAFIMPQDVEGNEPLDDYLVSIDDVEARTGLDFFRDLPQGLEDRLESRREAADDWALGAVANKPGRFQ